MYRNTIVLILMGSAMALHFVSAVNHWIVTEDGMIQPQVNEKIRNNFYF